MEIENIMFMMFRQRLAGMTLACDALYIMHYPCMNLRGHNWVFFSPLATVYCYLEFKFRYSKNLKLFTIRVKKKKKKKEEK